MAETTSEYCKKGDIIGIKGRVETSSYENEDGEKKTAKGDNLTYLIIKKSFDDRKFKAKDINNVIEEDDDLDM